MALLSYVLITPARNEAAFIEQTIQSVIAQTVLPLTWVIVSDGSTDGTDEIVLKYAAKNPWIELVRMPERRERNFAGKVHAFNAGLSRVAGRDYEIVANLDADITFDETYFAFLLQKFSENARLGVAGTPFTENDRHYDYRIVSVEHVSGACQMFRRACFEQIGGYRPLRTGGVDLAAVITARMLGWQTRSFPEKTCAHFRKMGSAKHGALKSAFDGGRVDYLLGCDPIWQLLRAAYRTATSKPRILGGALCLAGFIWGRFTQREKVLPADIVAFRRREERRRLRELIKKAITGRIFKAPGCHSAVATTTRVLGE